MCIMNEHQYVTHRLYVYLYVHDCSGSSGFVRYESVSPGTYTLRIVARAANGEREIERRKIHIGRYG